MKKGKVTATELACIKGMIAENIATTEMSTQLNRGLATIEKEVERIKADAVREQLFINKTASGSKGISIMTEAASVRGDVLKDNSSAVPLKKQGRSPWVHNIKDNG